MGGACRQSVQTDGPIPSQPRTPPPWTWPAMPVAADRPTHAQIHTARRENLRPPPSRQPLGPLSSSSQTTVPSRYLQTASVPLHARRQHPTAFKSGPPAPTPSLLTDKGASSADVTCRRTQPRGSLGHTALTGRLVCTLSAHPGDTADTPERGRRRTRLSLHSLAVRPHRRERRPQDTCGRVAKGSAHCHRNRGSVCKVTFHM